MKKLIGFLIIAVVIGCTCLGQLQTQYLYVDENCNAQVPDYTTIVNAEDNCGENVVVTQYPPVFSYISIHETGVITATDVSGNITISSFSIMLLDTIPPNLWFTDTIAYNSNQILDVYLTFVGWVIQETEKFEQEFDWEKFGLDPEDPNLQCYTNVICPDYFDWITAERDNRNGISIDFNTDMTEMPREKGVVYFSPSDK